MVQWQWLDGNGVMAMPVRKMGNEPVLLLQSPSLLLNQPPNSALLAQQRPLHLIWQSKFSHHFVKIIHLLQPLVEDNQLAIEGGWQPPLFWNARHHFGHFAISTGSRAKQSFGVPGLFSISTWSQWQLNAHPFVFWNKHLRQF